MSLDIPTGVSLSTLNTEIKNISRDLYQLKESLPNVADRLRETGPVVTEWKLNKMSTGEYELRVLNGSMTPVATFKQYPLESDIHAALGAMAL